MRYIDNMAAAAERRRIRRLIAPHLDAFNTLWSFVPLGERRKFADAIAAIDAATKAPRRARKGKR